MRSRLFLTVPVTLALLMGATGCATSPADGGEPAIDYYMLARVALLEAREWVKVLEGPANIEPGDSKALVDALAALEAGVPPIRGMVEARNTAEAFDAYRKLRPHLTTIILIVIEYANDERNTAAMREVAAAGSD